MPFGIPGITDSDQRTGFAPQNAHVRALEEGIQWNFFLPYRLQKDGLIKRHNGLLREFLFKVCPMEPMLVVAFATGID